MNSSDKTSKKVLPKTTLASLSNIQNHGNNLQPVKSVAEFLHRIRNIIKSYGNEQKNNFLFRGQVNEKWNVETSAYRRLIKRRGSAQVTEGVEWNYNRGLIQQYKLADFHSGNLSEIMKMDLGILAQLQHNGAATSLIDFSDNATIALWFACKNAKEKDGNNNNGKVFILYTGKENEFE